MESELGLREYVALRQVIAARVQLRATLTLTGVIAWAAILATVLVALPYPVASAVPLIVLAATFEVIRPLHFGAERIGRYLQVFFEEAAGARPLEQAPGPLEPPAWERAAMVFGTAVPGAAGHPLCAPVFAMATAVNFLAVVLPGPVMIEVTLVAVPHAAFVLWLLRIDRAMRTQRTRELARFRELRDRKTTT